ncbi:MAG: alpha/beta hydrolase [Chloroflexota bacterium]
MSGRTGRGGDAAAGRLLARPGSGGGLGPAGQQRLGTGAQPEGVLYVPARYEPGRPAPFALLLHGAGGNGTFGIHPVIEFADAAGLILLAPDSRGRTWDLLLDGYGPDVALIDRLLAKAFAVYAIDPQRLAVGGFSDGASYALSLGLTNGDLFTHVLAFSPGFMAPAKQRGAPAIYVSHGTNDEVLPIDKCSRRLVPALRQAGHTVTYQEFPGGHTVPLARAREAVEWFSGWQSHQ